MNTELKQPEIIKAAKELGQALLDIFPGIPYQILEKNFLAGERSLLIGGGQRVDNGGIVARQIEDSAEHVRKAAQALSPFRRKRE